MNVGEIEGMMNICIPYLVLEPIMAKLTTTFWVASSISKDESEDQVAIIQSKLEHTQVPFIVDIGEVNITIREFLTLGFGDVLQLNTKVEEDLPCKIGDSAKFLCRPGTSGKKMAVQITKILHPEGDDSTDE